MLAAAFQCSDGVSLLLWVVAVIVGLVGVVRLVGGDILVGVGCLVAAFLIGPGGLSLLC